MKKTITKIDPRTFYVLLVFLAVLILPFTAHAEPAQENGITFKDVEAKEWILTEVRSVTSGGSVIYMDRRKLEAINMGGIYTISFSDNRASGMGAPNRYFAPYAAGPDKTLRINNIGSTMMAAFIEPDGLKENEYFNYLSKVFRWDLKDGKLELYSTGSNGAETVLIFDLKNQSG